MGLFAATEVMEEKETLSQVNNEVVQPETVAENLTLNAETENAETANTEEANAETVNVEDENIKVAEIESTQNIVNGESVFSTELSAEEQEKQLELQAAMEDAKWYVLHTFSGYENVAEENLQIVIEKYNLHNRIFEIIIPMEDVVEEKNGKRKVVTRKLMPGYILVKMKYGDDIWHAVTRTRGITGFVGPKGRPLHLTEEEIRKMHLEKVTVADINIAPNDKVEVLEGPLNGFAGTVISVDAASNKCRVIVEMFGRETPVDLSLTQIRKLD